MALPSVSDIFTLYPGRQQYHPYKSFVAWNLTYAGGQEYFKRYWALYVAGTVFAFQEWHDAFVTDFLRQDFQGPAVDLAAAVGAQGSNNVFDLVFAGGGHKKGKIKRSSE